MTGNNIRVFSADPTLAANQVDRRVLSSLYADGCWGESASAVDVDIPLMAV
jgi:hypothetical protein